MQFNPDLWQSVKRFLVFYSTGPFHFCTRPRLFRLQSKTKHSDQIISNRAVTGEYGLGEGNAKAMPNSFDLKNHPTPKSLSIFRFDHLYRKTQPIQYFWPVKVEIGFEKWLLVNFASFNNALYSVFLHNYCNSCGKWTVFTSRIAQR